MMSTRTAAFVFSLVFSGLMAGSLHAGTFVTWGGDPSTGAADGVSVSVTYDPAPPPSNPFVDAGNMSGSNFDPPGASNQSYVEVDQDIGMTWTFDQPVEDLMLYLYFWRGGGSTKGGPPDNNYTFDQTPTIQSGLAGGTINGNSFVAPGNVFYSGILSFPGQLTSLSLLTPATGKSGGQGYTMSFNAVPEPASWMLLLGAAGTVALWRCRRRGSAALADGTGSGG